MDHMLKRTVCFLLFLMMLLTTSVSATHAENDGRLLCQAQKTPVQEMGTAHGSPVVGEIIDVTNWNWDGPGTPVWERILNTPEGTCLGRGYGEIVARFGPLVRVQVLNEQWMYFYFQHSSVGFRFQFMEGKNYNDWSSLYTMAGEIPLSAIYGGLDDASPCTELFGVLEDFGIEDEIYGLSTDMMQNDFDLDLLYHLFQYRDLFFEIYCNPTDPNDPDHTWDLNGGSMVSVVFSDLSAVAPYAQPVTNTDPSGIVRGWKNVRPNDDVWQDGDWYYADDNGAYVTGWREIDGNTYYFLPDGRMAQGLTEVDGVLYYFMEHPEGYGPGDGVRPDSGYLCRGGFFNCSDGSLAFTDDRGRVLAYDGTLPSNGIYFEYAFKACDILRSTPYILSCAFYDLDGDGIREFITQSGESQADLVYSVYKVEYDRLAYVKIGETYAGGGIFADRSTGHLIVELVHTSYLWVYEVTLQGGRLDSVLIYECEVEDDRYPDLGYSSVYEYYVDQYPKADPLTEPLKAPEPSESSTHATYTLDEYMRDMGFTKGQRNTGSGLIYMWDKCWFNLPKAEGGGRWPASGSNPIQVMGSTKSNAITAFHDDAAQSTEVIYGDTYKVRTGSFSLSNYNDYHTFTFSVGALQEPSAFYGKPSTHGYIRVAVYAGRYCAYVSDWLSSRDTNENIAVDISGATTVRIEISFAIGKEKVNGTNRALNAVLYDVVFSK